MPAQRSIRNTTQISPPCLLEKVPRGTRPSLGNLAALSRSGFRPMALRPALSSGLPFSKLEMNLWGQLFRRSVRSTFFDVPQVPRTTPSIDSPRTIRGNDNSIELCHGHSKGRCRIIVFSCVGRRGPKVAPSGSLTDAPSWCAAMPSRWNDSGRNPRTTPSTCVEAVQEGPPDERRAVRSRGEDELRGAGRTRLAEAALTRRQPVPGQRNLPTTGTSPAAP